MAQPSFQQQVRTRRRWTRSGEYEQYKAAKYACVSIRRQAGSILLYGSEAGGIDFANENFIVKSAIHKNFVKIGMKPAYKFTFWQEKCHFGEKLFTIISFYAKLFIIQRRIIHGRHIRVF